MSAEFDLDLLIKDCIKSSKRKKWEASKQPFRGKPAEAKIGGPTPTLNFDADRFRWLCGTREGRRFLQDHTTYDVSFNIQEWRNAIDLTMEALRAEAT